MHLCGADEVSQMLIQFVISVAVNASSVSLALLALIHLRNVIDARIFGFI